MPTAKTPPREPRPHLSRVPPSERLLHPTTPPRSVTPPRALSRSTASSRSLPFMSTPKCSLRKTGVRILPPFTPSPPPSMPLAASSLSDAQPPLRSDLPSGRDSALLRFRMRHPDGNAQMLRMISRHFRVPAAGVGSVDANESQRQLFESYLYLTQLQQARCYEVAFSTWRQMRSEQAHLMGLLYWQLNDIWQARQRLDLLQCSSSPSLSGMGSCGV